MGKRRFGRVRKLPPGQWQARCPGPDGKDHTAPYTFATKRSAEQWLTVLHAREERGQQIAATLDKMARRELSRARKRREVSVTPTRHRARSGHASAGRPLECQGNKTSD